MCKRESFVLFPETTGIPVAWSVSYHHEVIERAAQEMGIHLNAPIGDMYGVPFARQNFIQIECEGGDVKKWDWDNTAKKIARVPKYQAIQVGWYSPDVADYQARIEIDKVQVPDLPPWLEDNLREYENRVERILEQLNPWRDRAERLTEASHYFRFMSPVLNLDLDEMVSNCPPDSPEVREFEAIVNGYSSIPGFVYNKAVRDRAAQDVWWFRSGFAHYSCKCSPIIISGVS